MKIRVIPLIGPSRIIELDVHPSTLVIHLKEVICKMLGISTDKLVLANGGKILNEYNTLDEEQLVDEETYYLFPEAEGG